MRRPLLSLPLQPLVRNRGALAASRDERYSGTAPAPGQPVRVARADATEQVAAGGSTLASTVLDEGPRTGATSGGSGGGPPPEDPGRNGGASELGNGLYTTLPKPQRRVSAGNAASLAASNFSMELRAMWDEASRAVGAAFGGGQAARAAQLAPGCFKFTLSNEAILEFENKNAPPTREETPRAIKVMYDVLLFFVDRLFVGRAIERFWFLETVARMPYFSYVTCLHLYETLGWWRTAELRKIHFAEEWNELHHLLIMEALGGDARWRDRFLAFHAAILYYWALVVCFLASPRYSYKFSEMLETHAVSTYRQFLVENEQKLRKLPAPAVAKRYYSTGDLYMFDVDSELVRAATGEELRRPPVDSLYDVFANILEDEWEHVKTMVLCQDYDSLQALVGTDSALSGPEPADQMQPRADVRARWKAWAESLEAQEESFFDFEGPGGARRRRGGRGSNGSKSASGGGAA